MQERDLLRNQRKRIAGNIEECKAGAQLPNQGTIDAMAAKFGGRTMDGLVKKYGDGQVHIVKLK